MKLTESRILLEKYGDIVPGGVHSNFRQPVYFDKAQGPHLFDVDGNKYLDCIVNNGACILGHGDKDIEKSVKDIITNGLTVGLESELSLKVAKQLHEIIPSAEQVRFANTGTEAVMKALIIARAFTGKEKIIKFEGAYHGWFDEAQVSVHPQPDFYGPKTAPKSILETEGIRKNTLDTVLVVGFNDLECLERTIEINKKDVAALIIEPVIFNSGCIMPEPGYLTEVRNLTKKHNILLIFDEIITGFRLAPGGAQEYFGVIPDMSVFAKAIANGYPLSAVVGKRDMMEITRPGGKVLYGGTYNGQQAALAAATICIEKLKNNTNQKKLSEFSVKLSNRFNEESKKRNIQARMQQCGGEFQIYFTDHEVKNYRDAYSVDQNDYRIFYEATIKKGIYLSPGYLFHHGVSLAHGDHELEEIISAFSIGLDAVATK
jgi:glutamate-1-semialdehyde 2,1-aminomutase